VRAGIRKKLKKLLLTTPFLETARPRIAGRRAGRQLSVAALNSINGGFS
jgi:hypothetical protein